MSRTVFLTPLVVLLFLLLGAAFSSGQGPGGKKQQVLSRIKQAAAEVKTIESDFIQEKHLSIMENVLITKGRFYYQRPDRLRWELFGPGRSGFVVNGDRGRRWRGSADRQQKFDLDQDPGIEIFVKQVFAWARADFMWLEESYTITVVEENPAVLKLVPNASKEKSYLSHILLHFSKGASHVERVLLQEENGDYTLIRFLNTTINTPIPEDIF